MKIKGKEITKKMLVFGIMAFLVVGLASAALVSYVSNTITATATVTPATSVALEVKSGWTNTPEDGIGYTPGPGPVNLGSFSNGEDVVVNVEYTNPLLTDILTAVIGFELTYSDTAGTGDPGNCDTAGSYVAPGNGPCILPTNGCVDPITGNPALCIDGQEFEVIGIRNIESPDGGVTWVAWPDGPMVAAGLDPTNAVHCEVDYGGYWSVNPSNSTQGICFAGGALPAFTPSNPVSVSLPAGLQPIPSGTNLYTQLLIKPKADGIAGVQAAPGEYAVTVSVTG